MTKYFPWLTHTIGRLAPKFHKAARFRPDWPITEVEFHSDSDDHNDALETEELEREVAQLLERISGDLGIGSELGSNDAEQPRPQESYFKPLHRQPSTAPKTPLCAQVEL